MWYEYIEKYFGREALILVNEGDSFIGVSMNRIGI